MTHNPEGSCSKTGGRGVGDGGGGEQGRGGRERGVLTSNLRKN